MRCGHSHHDKVGNGEAEGEGPAEECESEKGRDEAPLGDVGWQLARAKSVGKARLRAAGGRRRRALVRLRATVGVEAKSSEAMDLISSWATVCMNHAATAGCMVHLHSAESRRGDGGVAVEGCSWSRSWSWSWSCSAWSWSRRDSDVNQCPSRLPRVIRGVESRISQSIIEEQQRPLISSIQLPSSSRHPPIPPTKHNDPPNTNVNTATPSQRHDDTQRTI